MRAVVLREGQAAGISTARSAKALQSFASAETICTFRNSAKAMYSQSYAEQPLDSAGGAGNQALTLFRRSINVIGCCGDSRKP